MSHCVDKHGRPIAVGDLVMVPCLVVTTRDRDGYNVGLETHHKYVSAFGGDDFAIPLACNSRQCELVTGEEGDGVAGD